MSTILITHMLGAGLEHADRIVAMKDGAVVANRMAAEADRNSLVKTMGDVAETAEIKQREVRETARGETALVVEARTGCLPAEFSGGASLKMGQEYLRASIAVVVIGITSVGGGRADVSRIQGAAIFIFCW